MSTLSLVQASRRGWSLGTSLALLAALPLVPLHRGVGNGAIAGRVTDPNGAPIQHAQVSVVGTSQSTVTDARGGYRVSVAPGTWTVRASLAGYKAAEAPGVAVVAGKTTLQHFTLEPGALQRQDVTVVGPDGQPRNRPQDAAALRRAEESRTPSHKGAQRLPSTAMAVAGGVVYNTEDYRYVRDNGFKQADVDPLSTFAIDVDGASYANVRRFLTSGQRPPADAVRIEELVNYFPYDHQAPNGRDPFGVTTSQMQAPWAPAHRLVMVGIQGKRIEAGEMPPANLVFLLDVSGSMQSPDKLPLVKRAFRLLVDQLRDQDRVAIVVYAGAAGLVLPSTPGSSKPAILAAIDQLEAGGSTAGGAGITLAYDVARRHHIAEGNNRVILATDGDFNVGASSEGELVRLIEDRKRQGTFLTVLGFGTGNLKDSRMEALANKGNGHYAYIDDILEARKVFVSELGGTLLTIARDVKVQVEFNPARVSEYRLIGYENRMLEHQDFNDDSKDGGELGAGHTVTAIYEVVPAGVAREGSKGVDPLKYRTPSGAAEGSGELATVKLRYQQPAGGASQLIARVVRDEPGQRGTGALRFAAAVVQYGMLLRDSEYKGGSSWAGTLTLAKANMGQDPGGYRSEFVRLVEVARDLYRVAGERGEEITSR
jgi:Ca-activated chloride channel family protein